MKKVISILLALMMLIGVCSISASAYCTVAECEVNVRTAAASYSKGDLVTFIVKYQSADDLGGLTAGTFEFGYDSSVFEPAYDLTSPINISEGTDKTGVALLGLAGSLLEGNSCIMTGHTPDATDLADNKWDKSAKIMLTYDGSTPMIDCQDGVDMFSFQLRLKSDASATGSYAVGVTHESLVCETTAITEEIAPIFGLSGTDMELQYENMFNLVNANVVVAAAGPSVANGSTQVQWADKANGKMNVAFRGIISGATLEYVAGSEKELSNITEVGVLFSKTDSELELADVGTTAAKVQSQSIYDYETGTYFYRAIVKDVAYDNAETLYFRAYIVVDGTTYLAPATESTTATAQYTRATAAGMAAFGA